ncbi:MAG: hypothetical protein NTV01_06190 [Bacteroidia bacterium]|nr:hypothetical protein [Bacteroidia bacterium]
MIALLDHQQVRIENASKQSESDVSTTSEIDIDHDDIRNFSPLRPFDLMDLKSVRIINKSINFSGNTSSAVWLPPKLSC